jgi:hypothetical protein
MTSAFPQPTQFDAFAPHVAAIPVPERGTHIPGEYVRNPHHDLNITVTSNGLPLLGMDKAPFVVGQVAPERRWAILADGELMDQETFKNKKQQNILEYYAMLQGLGSKDAKYMNKIENEPIPAVAYYVSWCVDPQDPEKVLQIGFNPHATDGSVSPHFHDSEGKQIEDSRIDVLCKAYASRDGRKQMLAHEIQEVEAHLGIEAAAGDVGVAGKLDILTEMHEAGEITDEVYIAKVGQLAGAGPKEADDSQHASQPDGPLDDPDADTGIEDPGDVAVGLHGVATCGKEGLKGTAGVEAHERRCKACREINGLEPWKADPKKKKARRKKKR